jgi:hypothetical protein
MAMRLYNYGGRAVALPHVFARHPALERDRAIRFLKSLRGVLPLLAGGRRSNPTP